MKTTYVDPNSNAIALLHFPIFILIVLALLIPKPQQYSLEDLQARDSLLSALFYALPTPAPRNLVQRWLINKLVEWIYQERGALYTLLQVGVSEIGYLPR